MKDLRHLHHFLGMTVSRSPIGMFLSQHHYIPELLEHAGMTGWKPFSTMSAQMLSSTLMGLLLPMPLTIKL
jgi:hypothetical protein